MLKYLLLFVLVFISSISFSQDYIVTLKSDTLRGKVKLLSYDVIDRVQISLEKKTIFTAIQVRRVSINGEQYAPVRLENSIRLMKVLRAGYISLYGYHAPGATGYETRIIQKLGQNATEVPNIGFKKFVGELVADCASVAEKVKNGDFDRNNVDDLVGQYNACLEANKQKPAEPVTAAATSTPVADLIREMKSKVNASDLSNKSDINDLLTSIDDKYSKKESIPGYMKEGLKGYLGSREDLKTDMEKLFALIEQ